MESKPSFLLFFAVASFLVFNACSLLAPAAPETAGPEAIYTQAAQTVVAQLTQAAAGFSPTPATPLETSLPFTDTPSPTATPTTAPSATPLPPTATPIPLTATPLPPTATPTATPIPCHWARFLEDISVKDGSIFTPNSIFTKTWRFKNIGTCTWTGDYRLAFAGGERMDGPRSMSLGESVDPGETIDVSVELIAPEDPGRHRGYWQFSAPSGETFGIGADAEGTFWVEINVVESDKYDYDFSANFCVAKWRSDSGRLECPGRKEDEDGFALLLANPVLEYDREENETALWTNPEDERDGFIRGEYPEFEVEEGQRFKAVIGCLNDSPDCNVIFQLNYRVGDGEMQTLWEAREVYDDELTRVDVDLSLLEGEEVRFVLTVLANGSPDDDRAFWLAPRIVH